MSGTEPASESRPPAPGRLRIVQDFINTWDPDEPGDALETAEGYGTWLAGAGLVPAGVHVTDDDAATARAVREALRRLALANNGGRVYPVDLGVLNHAAALGSVRLRFLPGASRLETQDEGAAGGLSRLLLVVHSAIGDGSWSRMKACREESCQWAFYDHSKNRSGTWCAMRVCGNRTKARNYRKRHHPGSPTAAGATAGG